MTTAAEIARAEVIATLEAAIAMDEAIIQQATRCTLEFVCFSEQAQMFLIVDAKDDLRFGSPEKARRFSYANAERTAAHWNSGVAGRAEPARKMTVEAMSVERGVMAHQERLKAALADIKSRS